jgi:ligand-binding sensor domain-containing protein
MARFRPAVLLLWAVSLFFVTATAAFAAASPWARFANPVFVRVDTRELPPTVEAIAQDPDGFLWVATQGGLARYDGYHFRVFPPNPNDPKALPDGYLLTMLADGNALLLGTESSGLVRFDEATETFRTWRPAARGNAGPRSATILALAKANDGTVWVGGDGGIDRFDPRTGTFEHLTLRSPAREPRVRGILVDHGGIVWVATSEGLFFGGARGFRAFPLGNAPHGSIGLAAVYEDHGGRVWAGARDAVYVVDATRRRTQTLTSNPSDAATLTPGWQRSFIEASPGVMWVGADSGLSIVDASTFFTHRVLPDRDFAGGITEGQTVGFLRDRSGLIWVANTSGDLLWHNAFTRGIYELSKNRTDVSFGDQDTISVAAKGSRLWVGGFKGSVLSLDSMTRRLTRYDIAARPIVLHLFAANDGTIWVGTLQGLCALRPGSTKVDCPAGPGPAQAARITAIAETPNMLWFGTEVGLVAQDETSHTIRVFHHSAAFDSISNDRVTSLHSDRSGRLWIGTASGLNSMDVRTGRVVRYVFNPSDANTIGPGTIETILQDHSARAYGRARWAARSTCCKCSQTAESLRDTLASATACRMKTSTASRKTPPGEYGRPPTVASQKSIRRHFAPAHLGLRTARRISAIGAGPSHNPATGRSSLAAATA